MQQPQPDLLTGDEFQRIRRRQLLPLWMKIFIWIFMFFGTIAPFSLLIGLIGGSFEMSIYGIESNAPFSIEGIIGIVIFALKGIAAYGLWYEKDWAINVAIADGLLGILICLYMMIVYPFISHENKIDFRLELLLLIPYLVKILKLRKEW